MYFLNQMDFICAVYWQKGYVLYEKLYDKNENVCKNNCNTQFFDLQKLNGGF